LTKYVNGQLAFLELAGLAFTRDPIKPVPAFHTKFSKNEATAWIHELCPRLTGWLKAKAIERAATVDEYVRPYSGPLFHPAVKSNRDYHCWRISEPMDGADLNQLLPSERRHLGKLVLGGFLLFCISSFFQTNGSLLSHSLSRPQ
jgi:hypothetical protein